jgi:uncharacterized membrane protein YcaP (DUF421 family)
MFAIDWSKVFVPSVSPVEIVVRGTIVYLTLFALMRFVLKRESGTVGLADLLMVVLIADAAQNAMAAEYRSVTDGILLVSTLIFWNFALDWLGDRIPWIARVIHPPPLLLVKNGRMLRRNMRREYITEEELMTAVREAGVDNLAKVREACMEGDGRISVISTEPERASRNDKNRAAT